MSSIKKPGFIMIVLVCAVSLILFKTHVGITSLDEDETGQEEVIEQDNHDEPDDNDHTAEDGDHDDDHGDDNDDSNGDDHSAEQDEHGVQLDDHQMEEYGIEIETAGPGKLQIHAEFPGEVVFNAERVYHVVPYIAGIVREVRKKQGDMVKAGEVIAVLDSRELSELQSSLLVAKERLKLAETTYKREENLWKQNISSEKEYLEAKQVYAEAYIELEVGEQKLLSLGFDKRYLEGLAFDDDNPLTYYELAAPFEGVVIEKHLTIGEAVSDDTDAFIIADLRTVWMDFTVYQKDLDYIRIGQPVDITAMEQNLTASGDIVYLSSVIEKETRTVTARIELSNHKFNWRPGMFITGKIAFDEIEAPVLIPRTALLMMDNELIVFVHSDEGFTSQPVTIGEMNETYAEVLSGLSAGQRYVAEGGFEIKAVIVTAGLGSHAGHGH